MCNCLCDFNEITTCCQTWGTQYSPILISSSVSASPIHSNWKSCRDWENFCTAMDRSAVKRTTMRPSATENPSKDTGLKYKLGKSKQNLITTCFRVWNCPAYRALTLPEKSGARSRWSGTLYHTSQTEHLFDNRRNVGWGEAEGVRMVGLCSPQWTAGWDAEEERWPEQLFTNGTAPAQRPMSNAPTQTSVQMRIGVSCQERSFSLFLGWKIKYLPWKPPQKRCKSLGSSSLGCSPWEWFPVLSWAAWMKVKSLELLAT